MFLVFKFNGFFLLRDKRGKNSGLFTIFNNRDLNYGSRLFYIGSMISLFETQMRRKLTPVRDRSSFPNFSNFNE